MRETYFWKYLYIIQYLTLIKHSKFIKNIKELIKLVTVCLYILRRLYHKIKDLL